MTTTKLCSITRLAAALAFAGIVGSAQAGIVTSTTANMPHNPEGFGAWNLDNVEVTVNGGGTFSEADGSYTVGDGTYDSVVDDLGPAPATRTSVVHGKDWPVGEPSGIKVINDDLAVKTGKPTNCLMTTSYLELADIADSGYLDTANPVQTRCSSGFQTHKRFKVNAEAASLGAAVDIVINIEPDATAPTRDYQVFQKLNNYTGQRLEGFIVQVGVGVGGSFQKAGAAGLTGHLWLSTPASIWDPEDIAPFAHGLFGPADKHFPEDGFFDNQRAGYFTAVTEYDPVNNPGIGDEFRSTGTQGSNYAKVPPVTGPAEQFGPWIHSGQLPQGIFFDDDGDPTTDAQLMGFWGETAAASGIFAWMQGNANNFAVIPQATIDTWAADPLYSVGPIEDLLNLGLNYVVTLGTVDATWPTWDAGTSTATFTIRMIPIQDTSGTGDPTYLANPPPPFVPPSAAGTASIAPSPTFVISQQLVVGASDNDLVGAGSVNVSVVNQATGESEAALTLTELATNQGTFSATLDTVYGTVAGANDDGTMVVAPGEVVQVTYTDADDGMGGINVAVTASTTAAAGNTGVLTAPADIVTGNAVSISLTDADLNTNTKGIDTGTVSVVNGTTGETELVTLEETGANTGIYTWDLVTLAGTAAGADSDGVMVVQAGDSLTTTYLDAVGDTGAAATATATTTVSAPASVSSSSGGGGGCSLAATDTRSNPTMPMLLGLMLMLGWLRRRRNSHSGNAVE